MSSTMSQTVERQDLREKRLYSQSYKQDVSEPRTRTISLPTSFNFPENKSGKIRFASDSSMIFFNDTLGVMKTEFDFATEEVATYDEKQSHSLNNWNWWEKIIESHENERKEDSDDDDDEDDSGDSMDVEDEFIFGSGLDKKISRIHVQDLIKHFDNGQEFCHDEYVPVIDKDTLSTEIDVIENDTLTQNMSCLKITKTKPTKKLKSIRFADTIGQDLTHIKYFQDEIPRIPLCAYRNLKGIDPNDFRSHPHYTKKTFFTPRPLPAPSRPTPIPASYCATTSLVPMFSLPSISPLYTDTSRGVCLESVDPVGPIVGMVRVTNLHPEKLVVARWTTDGWQNHRNKEAQYVPGSGDGYTELFTFQVCPNMLPVGGQLELCVRLSQAGQELWDNNGGENYILQAFPTTQRHTCPLPSFSIEDYL